ASPVTFSIPPMLQGVDVSLEVKASVPGRDRLKAHTTLHASEHFDMSNSQTQASNVTVSPYLTYSAGPSKTSISE
ncbi:hypothetical protein KIPB_015946, partial [Kipferlia bialata]